MSVEPDPDFDTDMSREEILDVLIKQSRQLREIARTPVTCPCGEESQLRFTSRCFHCHVYFCSRCSKKHFGPEHPE